MAKKDKIAKKKQHSFQLKEMRYRPKIDEHDFQFKTKHVREFIEAGSKVRVFVMFRGREMAHTEFGRKVLDRVIDELKDVAIVEAHPKQEGRNMTMVIAPTADVFKELKNKKAEKIDKADKKKEKKTEAEDVSPSAEVANKEE